MSSRSCDSLHLLALLVFLGFIPAADSFHTSGQVSHSPWLEIKWKIKLLLVSTYKFQKRILIGCAWSTCTSLDNHNALRDTIG